MIEAAMLRPKRDEAQMRMQLQLHQLATGIPVRISEHENPLMLELQLDVLDGLVHRRNLKIAGRAFILEHGEAHAILLNSVPHAQNPELDVTTPARSMTLLTARVADVRFDVLEVGGRVTLSLETREFQVAIDAMRFESRPCPFCTQILTEYRTRFDDSALERLRAAGIPV